MKDLARDYLQSQGIDNPTQFQIDQFDYFAQWMIENGHFVDRITYDLQCQVSKYRREQLNKAIDLTLKMHDNCVEEGHVMATKAKILEQLTKLK